MELVVGAEVTADGWQGSARTSIRSVELGAVGGIYFRRVRGSHVTDHDGTHRVRQGGPQRLWDRIEDLHRTWIGLGEPARERFG